MEIEIYTEKHWKYNIVIYCLRPAPLRDNDIYVTVYVHWMYFFVCYSIPLFALIIFNVAIYRRVSSRLYICTHIYLLYHNWQVHWKRISKFELKRIYFWRYFEWPSDPNNKSKSKKRKYGKQETSRDKSFFFFCETVYGRIKSWKWRNNENDSSVILDRDKNRCYSFLFPSYSSHSYLVFS